MERQQTAAMTSYSSGSEPAVSKWRNSVLFIRRHPTGSEDDVFMGSQPAWMKHPMETRPSVPQNGGNDLLFDRPLS